MESAQTSLKINYIVHTSVINVYAKEDQWFVHFDGSRESIAFGHTSETCPFAIGDEVKITIEKVS